MSMVRMSGYPMLCNSKIQPFVLVTEYAFGLTLEEFIQREEDICLASSPAILLVLRRVLAMPQRLPYIISLQKPPLL